MSFVALADGSSALTSSSTLGAFKQFKNTFNSAKKAIHEKLQRSKLATTLDIILPHRKMFQGWTSLKTWKEIGKRSTYLLTLGPALWGIRHLGDYAAAALNQLADVESWLSWLPALAEPARIIGTGIPTLLSARSNLILIRKVYRTLTSRAMFLANVIGIGHYNSWLSNIMYPAALLATILFVTYPATGASMYTIYNIASNSTWWELIGTQLSSFLTNTNWFIAIVVNQLVKIFDDLITLCQAKKEERLKTITLKLAMGKILVEYQKYIDEKTQTNPNDSTIQEHLREVDRLRDPDLADQNNFGTYLETVTNFWQENVVEKQPNPEEYKNKLFANTEAEARSYLYFKDWFKSFGAYFNSVKNFWNRPFLGIASFAISQIYTIPYLISGDKATEKIKKNDGSIRFLRVDKTFEFLGFNYFTQLFTFAGQAVDYIGFAAYLANSGTNFKSVDNLVRFIFSAESLYKIGRGILFGFGTIFLGLGKFFMWLGNLLTGAKKGYTEMPDEKKGARFNINLEKSLLGICAAACIFYGLTQLGQAYLFPSVLFSGNKISLITYLAVAALAGTGLGAFSVITLVTQAILFIKEQIALSKVHSQSTLLQNSSTQSSVDSTTPTHQDAKQALNAHDKKRPWFSFNFGSSCVGATLSTMASSAYEKIASCNIATVDALTTTKAPKSLPPDVERPAATPAQESEAILNAQVRSDLSDNNTTSAAKETHCHKKDRVYTKLGNSLAGLFRNDTPLWNERSLVRSDSVTSIYSVNSARSQ